jgi:hypothetical protein
MRLTGYLLVLAMAGAGPIGVEASQPGQQNGSARADEKAAMTQFEAAIARYMAIRQRLRNEIAGPVAGSTAAELNAASDRLAAAIQRARQGAREGNIFVVPVTAVVKRRVDDVVRRDNLGPVLADIDDEEPTVKTPSIHLRFPAASQMATMPPALLAALPELPKELEYRIIGSYLVLRDVDAALILDYIPSAVPRKP